MGQNIVEYLREQAVNQLFATNSFNSAWNGTMKDPDTGMLLPVNWKKEINAHLKPFNEYQIMDLGDCLSDVFQTASAGRTQGQLSSAGTNWESLVCWYLNLCLVGRNTVVIKHNKKLIPECVLSAMTVNYGSYESATESDLIAITFPERSEYQIDKDQISIINPKDKDANVVPTYKTARSGYNLSGILNALCIRDFNKIEIHIIQCKTNWNDNAQIPMLWDMVYYSARYLGKGISVGKDSFYLKDVKNFSYSFVTVPTVKLEKIKSNSVCVKRVANLSGGNYWGRPSASGIAQSLKEMLHRNLETGHANSLHATIKSAIPALSSTYSYFQIK